MNAEVIQEVPVKYSRELLAQKVTTIGNAGVGVNGDLSDPHVSPISEARLVARFFAGASELLDPAHDGVGDSLRRAHQEEMSS